MSTAGTYVTGKILERPIVEVRPLRINIPNSNPEIGYDSEYELDILSKNPIAMFLLTVKTPPSTWSPEEMFTLSSYTVTGETAWYEYELRNGYATFMIPNAAGKYHLTFGSLHPEQLTIKDFSW